MLRTQLARVSRRAFSCSSCNLHQYENLTVITDSEKAHFKELAKTWWDPTGPQRILHKMNLLRMDFITENIKSHIQLNENVENDDEKVFIPGWNYRNLLPTEISDQIAKEIQESVSEKYSTLKFKCLDIGCGGGLLSESLARLPVVESVRGVDMTPDVIQVANEHKEMDPILTEKLSYQLISLDDISKHETYDIVTCMEMLEHVEYPSVVLKKALSHVNPGGYLFLSTINRDFISWFTTIFMGEYVLKIVPLGTHTFSKYIKEEEVQEFVTKFRSEYEVIDSKGCAYLPACGWFFTNSPKIGNYMLAIRRKNGEKSN